MKKAAIYLGAFLGAIAFAWAAQESQLFRYAIVAGAVASVLYVLFRQHTPTKAETIAEFQSLTREQARLTALKEKAYQERWSDVAQASVAKHLAEVEHRLALYR